MAKCNRFALTLGEPAGIGPDICLQIAQQKWPAEIIVIGSPTLLQQRAKLLNLPIDLYEWDESADPTPNGEGRLAILPVPLKAPCVPGILNPDNSQYVIETLKLGSQLCLAKHCAALVTGPVHKAIINEGGIPFSGHTDFFKEQAGVSDVLMSFYTPSLILGLVTTHHALSAVSTLVTQEKLSKSIRLLHHGLLNVFKMVDPTITICGLNPHAGENGLLGNEEEIIIKPVIQALQQEGLSLIGPVSADTAFTPANRYQSPAILAQYHDQGLTPLKALFFGEIVNVTLGLPYLRTSVDHGTALALAGKGKADPTSLQKALKLAIRLCEKITSKSKMERV